MNSTPSLLLTECRRELLFARRCLDQARQLIDNVPLCPNPLHTEWVLKKHSELIHKSKTHVKKARKIRRMYKKALKADHRGQHVLTNKEKN